jgi:hypothetical protein
MFAYLTAGGAGMGWPACRAGGATPPQATTIKAKPDATPSRATSDLKITKPPPPPANGPCYDGARYLPEPNTPLSTASRPEWAHRPTPAPWLRRA